MVNARPEIIFKTSRSGGSGGQHVNKVETAVAGSFSIAASALFTEEQKQLLQEKLGHRLNAEGMLQVRSQAHRTQLMNKEAVIEKINQLLASALRQKKARIATHPPGYSKENRMENKKRKSDIKQQRQKLRPGN